MLLEMSYPVVVKSGPRHARSWKRSVAVGSFEVPDGGADFAALCRFRPERRRDGQSVYRRDLRTGRVYKAVGRLGRLVLDQDEYSWGSAATATHPGAILRDRQLARFRRDGLWAEIAYRGDLIDPSPDLLAEAEAEFRVIAGEWRVSDGRMYRPCDEPLLSLYRGNRIWRIAIHDRPSLSDIRSFSFSLDRYDDLKAFQARLAGGSRCAATADDEFEVDGGFEPTRDGYRFDVLRLASHAAKEISEYFRVLPLRDIAHMPTPLLRVYLALREFHEKREAGLTEDECEAAIALIDELPAIAKDADHPELGRHAIAVRRHVNKWRERPIDILEPRVSFP